MQGQPYGQPVGQQQYSQPQMQSTSSYAQPQQSPQAFYPQQSQAQQSYQQPPQQQQQGQQQQQQFHSPEVYVAPNYGPPAHYSQNYGPPAGQGQQQFSSAQQQQGQGYGYQAQSQSQPHLQNPQQQQQQQPQGYGYQTNVQSSNSQPHLQQQQQQQLQHQQQQQQQPSPPIAHHSYGQPQQPTPGSPFAAGPEQFKGYASDPQGGQQQQYQQQGAYGQPPMQQAYGMQQPTASQPQMQAPYQAQQQMPMQQGVPPLQQQQYHQPQQPVQQGQQQPGPHVQQQPGQAQKKRGQGSGRPNNYKIILNKTMGVALGKGTDSWPVYVVDLHEVPAVFGEKVQGWNRTYTAAKKIFGPGMSCKMARATIHVQHKSLYRESGVKRKQAGQLHSGDDLLNILHYGMTGDLRKTYTYVIVNKQWKFSETGVSVKDMISKHACHADAAEAVTYSGEFHVRALEDGDYALVLDNNSGTYAPSADDIPLLKRLFEINFPDIKIECYDFNNAQLKDYVEEIKAHNLAFKKTLMSKIRPGTAGVTTVPAPLAQG